VARERLFISYSHEDEAWRDRLTRHLVALEDILDPWSDKSIRIGSTWQEEIRSALEDAQAAILIVTPSYLSSSFIREQEIPLLLQRRTRDGIPVFAVVAEPCYWQRFAWLESMQVFRIADEQGPQPTPWEIDQKLTALMKQIDEAIRTAAPEEPARLNRQQWRERVVARLRGLEVARGQSYDDEKWHLGPELERLSDAIAAEGDDPEWRAAHDQVRNAVLLGGDAAALGTCVRELEGLR
jgi:TIR domain